MIPDRGRCGQDGRTVNRGAVDVDVDGQGTPGSLRDKRAGLSPRLIACSCHEIDLQALPAVE
jgi:hypothetical protein